MIYVHPEICKSVCCDLLGIANRREVKYLNMESMWPLHLHFTFYTEHLHKITTIFEVVLQ
jgi:hypothetical protein